MKVLVTGASRGIGNYLFRCFADSEYDQAIGIARNKPSKDDCPDFQGFEFHQIDLNSNEIFQVANQIEKLDTLIMCHAISSMNHFLFTPIETFKAIFETNFFSQVRLIQAFSRALKKGYNPNIICFSSIAVPLALEGESAYVTSKAALESLVKVLAKELGAFGIRINAIGPGPVKTDLIKNIPESKIKKIIDKQALKKFTEKSNIMQIVKFLAEAENITGQTIYLGGV